MPQLTRKDQQKIDPSIALGILVVLLALGCGIYLLISKGNARGETSENAVKSSAAKSHAANSPKDGKGENAAPIAKKRLRPDNKSTRPSAPTNFAQVDAVLTDDRVSDDEAARQLAEIALDPNVIESERLEAMEHGTNLGFSHLLPLSLDPNLAQPLAEAYLNGLHGHDQVKEQVSGALGLLNHSEAEIREQAQILLGFLLEAEEYNELPDKLRQKADEFLMRPDQPDEGDDEVSGQ
jgi:hypothetical protein